MTLVTAKSRRESIAPLTPLRVLPPVVLTALCAVTLVLTGVGGWQAGRIVVVVVLQTLTGVLVWRAVRGEAPAPWSELVGMGLALGTLTSLVSAQLLRPTPLAAIGWIVPLLLGLVAMASPRVRGRLRSGRVLDLTQEEGLAALLGLAAGAPFLWSFWRAHPLDWTGWWGYYVDIPYHEALSVSLSHWGPGDSILEAGSALRYHWFAHAWSGATTEATSAGDFVVMTRVLPVVALVGMVLVALSWARTLTKIPSVPFLAVLFVVLGMDVATQPPSGLMQIFGLSPSMSLAAMWLLAAALVVTELLGGRLSWPRAWPVLLLLAVANVGGKTSNAAALVGGVGLVALVSTVQRGIPRRTAWSAFGVVLAATGVTFLLLLTGTDGSLARGFGASAQTYTFLPGPGRSGIVLGTLAVGLAMAAKWAGVGVLALDRSHRDTAAVWLAVGAGIIGLFLMSVLTHPGSSQLYFPLSSAVVIAVVSAWGAGVALDRLTGATGRAAAVAGGGAGLVGLAYLTDASTPHRWRAPLVVWLLAVVVGVVAALGAGQYPWRRRFPSTATAGFALVLTFAAVTGGVLAASDNARSAPPAPPAENAALALADTQREALLWVRRNAAPEDVVATNRQCSGPQLGDQPCPQARWFFTAALTHRRMYIEGTDYAAESIPPPPDVVERVTISRRFVDAPGPADAIALWDAGVRWVVVDKASTARRDWAPFATISHATDTMDVLRLANPRAT